MSATFSLDVDPEVLRLAEEAAGARQISLSKMISEYLETVADNRRDSSAGKSPVTDSLRGSVKLPENFDQREAVEEALGQKYGEG